MVYKLGGAPRGRCPSPLSDWDSHDNDCAGNTVQHRAPRGWVVFSEVSEYDNPYDLKEDISDYF